MSRLNGKKELWYNQFRNYLAGDKQFYLKLILVTNLIPRSPWLPWSNPNIICSRKTAQNKVEQSQGKSKSRKGKYLCVTDENLDSCEDSESIISKVRKYSQQLSSLFGLSDVIYFCLIYPPLMIYYDANLN